MYCKYCKSDKLIKSEIASLKLATLECNHSVSTKIDVEDYYQSSEINKTIDFAPPVHSLIPFIPHALTHESTNEGTNELIKKEPLIKSSDGRVPYPFQEEGIEFVKESGFSALIADEMGLGKTIQALGTLKLYPKETLPALILAKSSLKLQWFGELVRWCGLKGYLPSMITDGKSELVEGFQVYIASYDILRRFSKKSSRIVQTKYGMEREEETFESPFYDFPFKTVYLDEAQSIKNIASKRTDEVFRICEGKQVIALSGTPFKNNIHEYYPILHLLRPDLFPTPEHFDKNFVKYGWDNKGNWKPQGLKDPVFFKQYTSKFIIRRTRDEVDIQFPSLNRVFYHVDFEDEKARREYEKEQYRLIEEYESKAASKNPTELLGIMAVCRHLVGLTKVKPTAELIQEFLQANDRKLVVFTHHKDCEELIYLLTQNYCLDNDLPLPLRFHSGLSDIERNEVIKNFREGDHRVLIASTLAAGEGLNLQFCSDCILTERQWNPANEEQAEGRFIRIGSTASKVNATYVIVSNTMDEWFTELVEEKRRQFKSVMDGTLTFDQGSLLDDLMQVIIAKGRKRTVRGF